MNEKKRHGRPRSRFTAKEILGYLAIITVLGGLLMVILKLLAPPAEEGTYNFYESPIMPLSMTSRAARQTSEIAIATATVISAAAPCFRKM